MMNIECGMLKSKWVNTNNIDMKNKLLFMVAVFCAVMVVPSCSTEETTDGLPNVVIIFTDDMGYGDLSCYGHPNIETPNLDRMADEGMRFTSFYVGASVCSPSRASLMTGRYPVRHMPFNTGPDSKNGLPLDETIMAEMLSAKGYATMAIGKWHLGHMPEYLPTSRGFDSFYGLPYSNDMILPWCPWLTEEDKLYLYEDTVRTREIGFDQDDLTVDYTNEALDFIESSSGGPFFLYLAHSMPHLPVSTSEQFRGLSEGGLYGDVVETIDWSVGQVMEKLEELGIADNTLLVFTSDNGPWITAPPRMMQRGVEPWHAGSVGMLRGSKGTTYEGGFRVPAIIRWPGIVPAGSVQHDMISSIDLYPTIAGITGAELPEKKLDGLDIMGVLEGKTVSPRDKFFYSRGTVLEAFRKGDLKLRITAGDGVQLFNLAVDPGERTNIADRYPGEVEKMFAAMTAFAEESGAEFDSNLYRP